MIFDDVQLKISRQSLEDLEKKVVEVERDDIWAMAEQASLDGQITKLKEEIERFESIFQKDYSNIEAICLEELPSLLIEARISSRMSESDLAEKSGISSSLIKKYEHSNYFGVSIPRLVRISDALDCNIRNIYESNSFEQDNLVYNRDEIDEVDFDNFPIQEIEKRGWLSSAVNKESVKGFISSAYKGSLNLAYHRKSTFDGKEAKAYSLMAWQARILEKADAYISEKNIGEFELNDTWLPELIQLSKEEGSPWLAQELLSAKGIALVFEPHLQGTYLDGAAMLSESGNPVIGMTLRHDRMDNFWFVLAHELGHIYKHIFGDSVSKSFVDEKVGAANDGNDLEDEADFFAQELLISHDKWERCFSRLMNTTVAVKGDAKRLGINPAIIAGRIRNEKKNYKLLPELVGQGTVRKLFFKE